MFITSISGNFSRITSDDENYYLISSSGLVVINKLSEREVGYGNTSYSFTDIWTTSGVEKLYIATSGNGLMSLIKSNGVDGDIALDIHQEVTYPEISSDIVHSVHGNTFGNVLIGTSSGVDILSSGNVYTSTDLKPVNGTFLLESNKLFYYGEFGLAGYTQSNINNSWVEDDLDFILDETSVPALYNLPIKAIDATEDDDYIALSVASSGAVQLINYRKVSTISTSSVIQLFKGV